MKKCKHLIRKCAKNFARLAIFGPAHLAARILDRVRKMGWLVPEKPRIPEEATPHSQ